jgi:hypothetical protein
LGGKQLGCKVFVGVGDLLVIFETLVIQRVLLEKELEQASGFTPMILSLKG